MLRNGMTRGGYGLTYGAVTGSVLFYPLGDDENRIDSAVRITNSAGTKGDRPIDGGLNDPHMGSTDRAWVCQTCGNKKTVCPGHYGSVELRYPVKSPLFRDELLKWLKIICHGCGELLVVLKNQVRHERRLMEVTKLTRAIKQCHYCKTPYRHVGRDTVAPLTFVVTTVRPDGVKVVKELFNHMIRDILSRVSKKTVLAMGRHGFAHPSKFIITILRAPPNTCRPDQRRIGGTRNNRPDMTNLLKAIIDVNDLLPVPIPPEDQINEALRADYSALDMTYTNMIRGGSTGEVSLMSNTGKPLMSISESMKSKHGRIRSNLMGKRTGYMIRSVITGDPHLRVDQVGVPLKHARNMQIPVTLSAANREEVMGYYLNGLAAYPGCSQIVMKSDGSTYRVEHISADYVPKIGDIIYRDMIDGDIVNLNRQPSLTFSSVAAMSVVVMKLGDTLRINPSVCNYFNADFDGDQMNAIVFQSVMARVEASMISKVSRYFVSPQTQSPLVGCFQDGLIGISEFTKHGIAFNKEHAMRIFGDITTRGIDFDFTKEFFSNRELVSRLLPKINMLGRKPKMYIESYAGMLNYHPDDIEVNIIRGELKSGVLDYSTVGQGVRDSVFHIIANKFGSDRALECVYNLQQIVHRFFLQQSFTVGIADVHVSAPALREIKRNIGLMVAESERITDTLNKGDMVAPLGVSLAEHWKAMQINVLSAGDTFSHPVLSDINLENNGLARLIFSKSKGNIGNLVALYAAIGHQLIDGKINPLQVGYGRSSIYFSRYCTEPAALGFIETSFVEGVSSEVYHFMAAEARYGITCNALKTAVTGYRNRINIKNMESAIINNLRQLTKGANIMQVVYADCGLDPARCELVLFPTITISDAAFKAGWHTDVRATITRGKAGKAGTGAGKGKAGTAGKGTGKSTAAFPSQFHTPAVQKLMDEEFAQLVIDRDTYTDIHMTVQAHDPREYIFSAKKQMPVNVRRIISDAVFEHGKVRGATLNPVTCINQVRALCDGLGYVFSNDIQRKKKARIPEHIQCVTAMMKILLRSYLSTSYLVKIGVTDATLQIILEAIIDRYIRALCDYGSAAGILAAQCLSEPLTQFVLNSKHRSGQAGGTKTNGITRAKEIFDAVETKRMENPSMIVALQPEFEHNELKANEIANNIEMMRVGRFIHSTHIFFEEYGNIRHPLFQSDIPLIKQVEKHNVGQRRPGDLAAWCIRFGMDRDELVLKCIEIEAIIYAVRRAIPELYLLYTPGNAAADSVFIRCYIRNGMIKSKASDNKSHYYSNVVLPLMKRIKEVIVRGVEGVISAQVIQVNKNVKQADGSIAATKVCAIATAGSNLLMMAQNEGTNKYLTMTDSIREVEALYGIMAARAKIINEFVTTLRVSPFHASLFADEMIWTGQVVNIHAPGLRAREPDGIFVRASFQKPVQILADAAARGVLERMHGPSAALMVGGDPRVGTHYNRLVVNEAFVDALGVEEDDAMASLADD